MLAVVECWQRRFRRNSGYRPIDTSCCADYSFSKDHRLRKRCDYQRTWKNGRKLRTKNFLIVICNREDNGSDCSTRIGITVSRKVGGAVVRNRVKRKIREFSRLNYRRLPAVADISIIARPGAAAITSSQLYTELQMLFGVVVKESSFRD